MCDCIQGKLGRTAVYKTTIKELEQKAQEAGITKTALVLVGDFLGDKYAFSKLYDPDFKTEYRK